MRIRSAGVALLTAGILAGTARHAAAQPALPGVLQAATFRFQGCAEGPLSHAASLPWEERVGRVACWAGTAVAHAQPMGDLPGMWSFYLTGSAVATIAPAFPASFVSWDVFSSFALLAPAESCPGEICMGAGGMTWDPRYGSATGVSWSRATPVAPFTTGLGWMVSRPTIPATARLEGMVGIRYCLPEWSQVHGCDWAPLPLTITRVPDVAVVPEPATLVLVGGGLALLGLGARRRRAG